MPTVQDVSDEIARAIGKASISFNRLEIAFTPLLALIADVKPDIAFPLYQALTNEQRIRFASDVINARSWPAEMKAIYLKFPSGYKICLENRNQIMHSIISDDGQRLGRITKKNVVAGVPDGLAKIAQAVSDNASMVDFALRLTAHLLIPPGLPIPPGAQLPPLDQCPSPSALNMS